MDLSMMDYAGDEAYSLADMLANVDTGDAEQVKHALPHAEAFVKRITDALKDVRAQLAE